MYSLNHFEPFLSTFSTKTTQGRPRTFDDWVVRERNEGCVNLFVMKEVEEVSRAQWQKGSGDESYRLDRQRTGMDNGGDSIVVGMGSEANAG